MKLVDDQLKGGSLIDVIIKYEETLLRFGSVIATFLTCESKL